MLKQKRSRQTWWPLYVLALIIVGLLFLAHHLAPSLGWRIFLEVGVLGFGYGLIAFWLDTHSDLLLDRPAAETNRPAVKLPLVEAPAELSSRVPVHFHVGSDPALDYSLPEPSTSDLRSNGHYHPARIILALPEEAAKQFSNN
jgi:hypothetical protein